MFLIKTFFYLVTKKYSVRATRSSSPSPRAFASEARLAMCVRRELIMYVPNKYLILILGSIFLDRNVQVYLKKVAYSKKRS